jgi:hypothetical protein
MIGANIPAPPAAAGVSGSTGSTDNAILRADGTGGATLQNSDLVIDDATTSTQNNVAITNQHSGQTNSSLVLSPKGTGAFILGPKPDGAATGGNARGTNGICLVRDRSLATQVASGTNSIAIGRRATASNASSIAIGNGATASGNQSLAIGLGDSGGQSTGDRSIAIGGQFFTVSGQGAVGIIGGAAQSSVTGNFAGVFAGTNSLADRYSMQAHAAGIFASNGDAQRARFVMRNKTTTNSAVELFLDGSSTRLTIPSGKIFAFTINISGVKSDGTAVAHYLRQYCLKNVAGTTSQVYAPVTIGTDNAAGTSIALSANDTNDALKVEVTGIAAETWRWVASVDAVEIAYGA